tara:strand:- start:30275 stop:30484 length:210 start_codon:yes stop_codon:yes gene_type:complete
MKRDDENIYDKATDFIFRNRHYLLAAAVFTFGVVVLADGSCQARSAEMERENRGLEMRSYESLSDYRKD